MRGRKNLPVAVHQLNGNPGKRRRAVDPAPLAPGVAAEPAPTEIASLKVPPPPKHLTKFAREEWTRIAESLVRLGLLRALDLQAFVMRCEQFSTWRKCKGVIARKGSTYELNGVIRLRPEVRLMQDAAKQMARFDSEFGLTPAARARVAHVTDPNQQPPLPLGPPAAAPAPKPAAPQVDLTKLPDDKFFAGPPN